MNDEDEIITYYLNDLSKIPLLTADEEKELTAKAAAGSKEAKNKLVQSNLRFVFAIAKTYRGNGLELADLISEGNIGLMTAADRFKPSKEVHFITYAVWWIRQSIQKAIYDKGRAVRLPSNICFEITQVKKTRSAIETEKREEEQIKEVAKILHMDEDKVRKLFALEEDVISLESTGSADVSKDSKEKTLGEKLCDPRTSTPEEAVIEKLMKEDIENMLNSLREEDQKVLRMRYGFYGNKPKSLSEVGSVFGLSKERIRQIQNRAIETLMKPSKRKILESYIAA